MVTADNLNLDVLEVICGFLSEEDLPSVALVNQSFLAAALPKLYHNISYGVQHSKAYGGAESTSPFATVMARPHLAVHIRQIEIRFVPRIKSAPHPVFMRECREALALCNNMTRFICTAPHVLPILLPSLQNKTGLKDLRVFSSLTTLQTKMLSTIKNLTNLMIQFASWNVVDVLPSWMKTLSSTLHSLTLFMVNDLHEDALKRTLEHLPNLRGLNVIGCPKVNHLSVLRLVCRTPLLESLSMTTSLQEMDDSFLCSHTSLRFLKHLALEVKYGVQPPTSSTILGDILAQIRPYAPHLTSFALRLPERKFLVGETFVSQLVEHYGFTLKRLSFLDCSIDKESIEKICKSCIHLEELHVAIPMKDLAPFAQRISMSKSLVTLVDVDNHIDHGVRSTLNSDDVRYVMCLSPNLRTIVTTHRIWTGQLEYGIIDVTFKKRYPHKLNNLWFIPSD